MYNEFFLAASVILIIGAALHALTRKKRTVPATKCLANVMQGKADLAGVQTAATMLAAGVRRHADKLNRPALFLRACGDLYEDFFPPNLPDPALSAKARANLLMAAYIRRYTQAGARKPANIGDVNMFTLCEGAGYGLATFRRLAEIIPDMVFVADTLGPRPTFDERESYAAYYREAGRLTNVPLDLLESSLSVRLAAVGSGGPQEHGPG
ncbi:MAG: hypothetical protein LIP28_05025 [Deltaproteobacteria bacterium]|nr:hypothetical protein [Deltaproteobacteria bacterium]